MFRDYVLQRIDEMEPKDMLNVLLIVGSGLSVGLITSGIVGKIIYK